LVPKAYTRNCPKAKNNPEPTRIYSPCLSYKTPRGIIKNMAIALGKEYSKLN
jgi:hypothetical protein